MATRVNAVIQAISWLISTNEHDNTERDRRLQKVMQEYKRLRRSYEEDRGEQAMLLAEEEEEFTEGDATLIEEVLEDEFTHGKMETLCSRARSKIPLSKDQFLFYLRCILVHVTIDNGQRAGPICNATVDEV